MANSTTDRPIQDSAPSAMRLTAYDREHATLYLRLLDAERDAVDWREAAQILLGVDPEVEPERAEIAWRTHLARAHWMTRRGYSDLLSNNSER